MAAERHLQDCFPCHEQTPTRTTTHSLQAVCHGGDLEQLWSLEGSPDGPPAIIAEIISQLQQRQGSLQTPGLFLSAATLADVVQLALVPAPGGSGGLQQWTLQPGQAATESSVLKEISTGKHPATKRLSRGDAGRVKDFLKCHPTVAGRVLAVQQAVVALNTSVRQYAQELSERVAAAEGDSADSAQPIDDPGRLSAARKDAFLRHAASMAALSPGGVEGGSHNSDSVRVAKASHRPRLSELWPHTRLRQAVAPILAAESDPVVLVGLLVEVLRNLTEPLIPKALGSAFTAGVAESEPPLSQHAQLVALRSAVSCLPPANRLTLQALVEVCALDLLCPENAAHNGLRADALSGVLGPLLLPPSCVQLPYCGETLTGSSSRNAGGGSGGSRPRQVTARPVDVSEGAAMLEPLPEDAALVLRTDTTCSDTQPGGDSFVIPATRGGNAVSEVGQGGVHMPSSPTPSMEGGATPHGQVSLELAGTLDTVPERTEETASPPAGVPVSNTTTAAHHESAPASVSVLHSEQSSVHPPPVTMPGTQAQMHGGAGGAAPVQVAPSGHARAATAQAPPASNARHAGSARSAVAVGSLTAALAEGYAAAVCRMLLAHFVTLFHGTNADALECEMLSTQQQSKSLVAARWALRAARAQQEDWERRRMMSAAVALQRLKLKRAMAAWSRIASQGRGRDAVHGRVRLLSSLVAELGAEVDEQAAVIERLKRQLREHELQQRMR